MGASPDWTAALSQVLEEPRQRPLRLLNKKA
jgi:hypothetical protein